MNKNKKPKEQSIVSHHSLNKHIIITCTTKYGNTCMNYIGIYYICYIYPLQNNRPRPSKDQLYTNYIK